MNDENKFLEVPDAFAQEKAQLQRRQALARSMIENSRNNGGAGYHGGRVFFVGNQLGNLAQSLGGTTLDTMSQRDQQDLTQRMNAADTAWQNSKPDASMNPEGSPLMPVAPTQADQRQWLSQAPQTPASGKRQAIEQAFMKMDAEQEFKRQEAEANRLEKSEQEAANRVAKSEENEANRQNMRFLKSMPSQSIHITNSGGGNASPFAGAATQVGVDARDPTRAVYRIGKTGQVFSFDENGQPAAHEGAIAPKPAAEKASTESERSAAGYLGRMEAAEANLTNAPPLNLAKQKGMERSPSLTNYALTEQEQKTYQQQADWVRAKLRKESGAVIGDAEMAAEIRTYFPQAGDSKAVLASKAQSRAQAQEQMRSSAGKVKPTIAPQQQPTTIRKFNPATGRLE